MKEQIRPVILCGGSGTRLWPLSRGLYPKQFMDLGGSTLFSRTLERAAGLPGASAPLICCNAEHRFLAAAILQDALEKSGAGALGGAEILLEPMGRNTAPAVALAALAALADGEDPHLLVLSSDHVIEPAEKFYAAVDLALGASRQGGLVVFGVPPTRPETGFGYITQGKELAAGVHEVGRFVEKPSEDKARAMIAEGGCFWNSGMFMFRASLFLAELQKYAPDMHSACLQIWESRKKDLDFTRFDKEAFAACPENSLDYAVMEHTRHAAMVKLAANWSDLGSWEAFYDSAPHDGRGNALTGDVVELDSENCYLHATSRLLAAIGLKNISVVETPDAVLVLERGRGQDVKKLLAELKLRGRTETDTHLKVYRPWGSYETLALSERFQVKRIIVNPGATLSLQLHHHRAEHWVVVRGTAKVTVGEEARMLSEDMSTYIPLGNKHRLENPGRIPLELIEIQTGSYLGEDDIVRFEDTYGRIR